MYRKCCVKFCTSKQDAVLMHKIPRNAERQRFWLEFIDNRKLDNLSNSQYCSLKVCERHFESRFKNRFRLRCGAYPTLFTADEIAKGVPNIRYKVENRHCKSDHNNSNNVGFRHNDHNYIKRRTRVESVGNLLLPSDKIRSRPSATYPARSLGTTPVLQPVAKDNLQPTTSGRGSGTDENATSKQTVTEEPTLADSAADSTEYDDFTPTSPDPPPDFGAIRDENVFSWQKSELIPADEDEPPQEEVVPTLDLEGPGDPSGLSLYDEPEIVPCEVVPQGSKEVEYRCKECGETIEGFQFWCVQCVGSALCGTCEALGTHRAHYVLRVPAGKPQSKTEAILETIRLQLLSENLIPILETDDDGVKLEVKEEPVEPSEEPPASPPAEPDPLAVETAVADPVAIPIAVDSPPFKRPRLEDYRAVTRKHPTTSQNEPKRSLVSQYSKSRSVVYQYTNPRLIARQDSNTRLFATQDPNVRLFASQGSNIRLDASQDSKSTPVASQGLKSIPVASQEPKIRLPSQDSKRVPVAIQDLKSRPTASQEPKIRLFPSQDSKTRPAILLPKIRPGILGPKSRPVAESTSQVSTVTATELPPPIDLDADDDDVIYTEIETLDDEMQEERLEEEYIERIDEEILEEDVDRIEEEILEEDVERIEEEILEEDVERIEEETLEEDVERIEEEMLDEDIERIYETDSEVSEYVPEKRKGRRVRSDDDTTDESDLENIATRELSRRIGSVAKSKTAEVSCASTSDVRVNVTKGVDKRELNETGEILKVRGPEEAMSKMFQTKALVQVRPLSTLEVKKWTGSSKD